MGKTAFIFPGQGAQYAGMGADFCEKYGEAAKVYEEASDTVGMDVRALCFEKNDRLDLTEYTQIAMAATEIAILRVILSKGIKAELAAGLSLGEYGALAACSVMKDRDIFRVVRKRGIYMQNAYPSGGGMTAVLGMDGDRVSEICEIVAKESGKPVSVANYNCPGQIVITGEKSAVDEAAEKLAEAGAKRCIPLKVSGPFHSMLLKEASGELGKELDTADISDPAMPYVTNVTADYVTEKDEVKELLVRQIYSPVKWQQSIERMAQDGTEAFIEIGPGKTLTGFMKKIDPSLKAYHIGSVEELEKYLEETDA
ncbi:MAG: ACP S-malonyltransferase [Lachnospiraceae bacterium]|nr:ACP S-malonyltransferase [Lachnospiraceae bacterium]